MVFKSTAALSVAMLSWMTGALAQPAVAPLVDPAEMSADTTMRSYDVSPDFRSLVLRSSDGAGMIDLATAKSTALNSERGLFSNGVIWLGTGTALYKTWRNG